MKSLLLGLLVAALAAQPAFARPRSTTDRELIAGAKKEKQLVFYTTLDLPQTILVVNEFVQKYPFLDLELHPIETELLVERVQTEARASVRGCDVLIGGGGFLQPLFTGSLISSYYSPERQFISEGLNDRGGFWSGFYINHYALGYNKTLIKPQEAPRDYKDLLEPRWKGNRIAIDRNSHGILRGLGATWGAQKAIEYLKRLADQQPVMARASITAVEAMHLGSVPVVIARAPVIKGYIEKLQSPFHWALLPPVIAQVDVVMMASQSPHPNAARLFIDFVLSREGQKALGGIQQIPVRRDMRPAADDRAPYHEWFVELPDRHVNFRASVQLFREIFGMK